MMRDEKKTGEGVNWRCEGVQQRWGNESEKVETEDMWRWRKTQRNAEKMREVGGEMCMSQPE